MTAKDMSRDRDMNDQPLEYANRYKPIQDPPLRACDRLALLFMMYTAT